MTSYAEFQAQAAAARAEIRTVRSKPLNRGVIRVDYYQTGRTFFVFDHSDNSEGFYRVVGKQKLQAVLNSIEAAA